MIQDEVALKTKRRASQRAIDNAASAWAARHALGSLGQADREHFQSWLADDPRHRAAFASMSFALGQVGEDAAPIVRGAHNIARQREASNKRKMVWGGSALGLCLLIGFASPSWRVWTADQRTAKGEVRSMMLADGSQLWLDADTAIDVDLTGQGRDIRLIRGRIMASVKHEARPFRILVGADQVRDIGTVFEVSQEPHALRAQVSEGRVVAHVAGRHIPLAAGDGVTWQEQNAATAQRYAARNVGDWRSGRFAFSKRPLGSVLDEMARYSTRRIILLDRQAADRRVTGVVRIGDIDDTLASLAKSQGLGMTDIGFAVILR